MSCWRKYSAKVLDNVDMDLLKKACDEMGVSFDPNIKHVENSYGENAAVDAALVKDGETLPLGFRFVREDGKTKLQLEGDFWRTGLREESFLGHLSQQYQKFNIMQQAEAQGWIFDRSEVVDGNVVLEAYQW